jgi:DNA helicase HerA-like ATPase
MESNHAYLRLRPSDASLPIDRITGQFEQLHRALGGQPIECLLVADPDADEIAYYFGATTRTRDTLYRILDRITPDSYPIEPIEEDPLPEFENPVAAEFHGIGERRLDWQTRLRPPAISDAPEQHNTARVEAAPGLPLESIIQGMTTSDSTVVYQALLKPKPDWSGEAEYRVRRIDHNEDTFGQRLFKFIFGPVERDGYEDVDRHSPRRSAHRRGDTSSLPGTRIDAILAKSSRNSFDVNARLLASGPDAEATVRDLASTFNAIGGDYYDVRARVDSDPDELHTVIEDRTFKSGDSFTTTLKQKVPLTANRSPRIVADSTTVPHFCLLDGASLTDSARRSLRALPEERTGITPPDEDKLAYYTTGLRLGNPKARDGTTLNRTVALPPALQPLHVAWFGKTGSGKTTSLINAILGNHTATDGADIIIDRKGDGMPIEYLRSHYAEYGTLENVYYFDCAETLPALSFFDIRDQLADGVSRTTAVQDIVDHYIDILRGVMSSENFDSAVRSPDVIRYLVKALFDPEYGADAYTHRDLQRATRLLRESQTPPQVSDDDLRGMLGGITENDQRSFDIIMQGVANRIEKIPLDDRLGRVFNHVPRESGPEFDMREVLDEDATVIFDLGGLRPQSQQALTLVLLSKLWTALQRRKQTQSDPPIVNLYLDEAASLAVSDLLTDLLAQSRGFGLSVTLAMQFPGQLREQSPRTYEEVLNNVGSIVTGNVSVDSQLQQRLATEAIPPEEVGNRLRALSRGEWFTSLAAPFGEPRPQPFVLDSLPLPPGHPESDQALSPARETAFDALVHAARERTRLEHGLAIDEAPSEGAETRPPIEEQVTQSTVPVQGPITSALPYTSRFPSCIEYREAAHAIECGNCHSRYAATSDGVVNAIECCASLERVDRDEIPVCGVNLRLTANERAASAYSDRQLLFLQLVYDGQFQRFDPDNEYDLYRDSMIRLREYAGLDPDDVRELVEDGLLRKDCDRPFRLYTVTPAGRNEIQVSHTGGVGHGDGVGDLGESSHHRLMVAYGRQYIIEHFVEDADSTVVKASIYHQVGEDRLDVVGLDADGDIVVALEAERGTNDTAREVLADFDKMAACEPLESIWVCDNRDTAHAVLNALNDPIVGSPRVEKSYSQNTPPTDFSIDTTGLSQMTTLSKVMSAVERPTPNT